VAADRPNARSPRPSLLRHRTHAIVQATVDEDLSDLERAVGALTRSLEETDPGPKPGTT